MPQPRLVAKVFIGREKWTILRCKVPRDRWGDCNHDEKTIRVSDRLSGTCLLNVLLHEMIHARWWCLDEGEVDEFAEEAAGVLESFGFHDEEKHDG
jgi:hypothetical protein